MHSDRNRATELSSRALWRMVNRVEDGHCSDSELAAAVEELARRRRYLQELRDLGKLGKPAEDPAQH